MYIYLHNAKRILSAITALSMCGVPMSQYAMYNGNHTYQGEHGRTSSTNARRSPDINKAICIDFALNGNAIKYTYARYLGEWRAMRLPGGGYTCPASECRDREELKGLSLASINAHVNENHYRVREYQCVRCGDLFLRRNKMRYHTRNCRYPIDETLLQRVRDFRNRHHPGGYYKRGRYAYTSYSLPCVGARYQCPHSNCQMSSKFSLKVLDHINTQHIHTVDYICAGCGFTAGTSELIRSHIYNYASSTERDSLRSHVSTSSTGTSHVQTAQSGNVESSETCGLECSSEGRPYKKVYFTCNDNIIVYVYHCEHERKEPIHIGDGRYACPYQTCQSLNINFSEIGVYNHIHEKHDLSYIYQCARCRATYSYLSEAKYHVSMCPYEIDETLTRKIRDYQYTHTHTHGCYTTSGYTNYDSSSLPRSPDNTTYTCPKCDKEFWCTQSALDHINKAHERTLKYLCTCCAFWSFSYKSMKCHISGKMRAECPSRRYETRLDDLMGTTSNRRHEYSTISSNVSPHSAATQTGSLSLGKRKRNQDATHSSTGEQLRNQERRTISNNQEAPQGGHYQSLTTNIPLTHGPSPETETGTSTHVSTSASHESDRSSSERQETNTNSIPRVAMLDTILNRHDRDPRITFIPFDDDFVPSNDDGE